MKSVKLILAAVVTFGALASNAQGIRLNDIDTNNCARAQHEVMLLNNQQVAISAICSAPGVYGSDQGHTYQYRLYTTLSSRVGAPIFPGQVIRLNDIDTNDCRWAQSEISLLNKPQYTVQAVCSAPGQYVSNQGQVYMYRMFTTVRVNF